VLKLREAADPGAFVAEHGPEVGAIATRGDLGALAALMRALPKLEIVACFGVGTDAIDLGHAGAAGIRVTNTPDVLTADVADLAVGLLLAAGRRIPHGDALVRSGGWARRRDRDSADPPRR
jgi:D-3-phosphoglycerate dehydrogenase